MRKELSSSNAGVLRQVVPRAASNIEFLPFLCSLLLLKMSEKKNVPDLEAARKAWATQ